MNGFELIFIAFEYASFTSFPSASAATTPVSLIDLTVVDEEENEIGILVDVMKTGANDVYIVKNEEGKELLFPAIKECILNVDFKKKQMKVHVMDGLLD